MTTRDERLSAIDNVGVFLSDVAHGAYKRTPKDLRLRAYQLSRHYPTQTEFDLHFTERK